ncbi:MAG: methyltransferase [Pseudomonadota bacterium]
MKSTEVLKTKPFAAKAAGNLAAASVTSGAIATTTDAFHDGKFEIVQPKDVGHRVGLDALLLAASLPKNAIGLLGDLGAGSGAAGFAALSLFSDLDLVSIELNDVMFDLLSRSANLNSNSHLRNRVKVLRADVIKSGKQRIEQGLADEMFDHVIMNPPYYTGSYRPPADKVRSEAHVLGDGGLDAWFRTAAATLRNGGSFSLINRSENLAAVIASSQGRFGELQIIPIHSRADEAAKRILVRSIKGSKAPLVVLPGLVIHESDGSFTPRADAIFKGEAIIGD